MVERLRFGFFNCYLLHGSDGAVLLDTGPPSARGAILKAVQPRRLRAILLSHGHVDHIGNARFLSEAFDVPIFMHPDDFSLIADPSSRKPRIRNLVGFTVKLGADIMNCGHAIEPFTPSSLLPGDSLERFGLNGCIIGLPGHTKGSLGILTDDGTLLVGDAMFNLAGPGKPPLYEDQTEMEQSFRLIQTLGARQICFGHGGPLIA